MSKIQQIITKKKDGTYQQRYFITLSKSIVDSKGLKKGDSIIYNGEDRGELRFIIKRC